MPDGDPVEAAQELTPEALAHAPLGSADNEDITRATAISDPTKSWAIYGELHEGGEAQYYRFDIQNGQTIHVMLFKPTAQEDTDFTPNVVLMGPQLTPQGRLPDFVQVPQGAASFVVEGRQVEKATYEPFSPGSLYYLGEVSLNAPTSGTYFIAVYEPNRGGHYGLAVGDREEFTLSEWVLIPVNQLSIYQWERQSLVFILAPLIAVVILGLALATLRRKSIVIGASLLHWTEIVAGLFFLGSGFSFLYQILINLIQAPVSAEVVISIIFALIPMVLGILGIRLVLRARKVRIRTRISLIVLGFAALFTWSGLIVGPVLAVLASALPGRSEESVGKP